MKRYQPRRHPVAFGFVALTMTVITIGAFGLAPAVIEPANALTTPAAVAGTAPACHSNLAEPAPDRHSTRASTTRPTSVSAHPRAFRLNHPS